MRRKYIYKIAVFMCIVITITSIVYPYRVFANDTETDQTTSKYDNAISEINNQLESLDEEKRAIQQNIDNARTKKETELANKEAVEYQIEITQKEVALLSERLALLQADADEKLAGIQALQERIDEKQTAHDERYTDYLTMLRRMQLYDEGTKLSIILGADSYADYLSTNEYMRRMTEYDRNLMDVIKSERTELEQDKGILEVQATALEATRLTVSDEKQSIEAKRQDLSMQQQSIESNIQDINEMERQFKADLAENQKQQAQMQAELERIFQQIEWDKNPYVGGNMLWPVPGFYDISSYYGMRFQNTDFHTGVDIFGTGIHGQSVVAANDGTVRTANWTYTPGKGYGIYVIIDHGGNTATLYAHLSNITVNVGDVVKKGDVIGNVGNTGWSTGPHLHFEVRIDKKHVNPLPYLQGEK